MFIYYKMFILCKLRDWFLSFLKNKTDINNNGIGDRDEFVDIIKKYLEEDDNKKIMKKKINELLK